MPQPTPTREIRTSWVDAVYEDKQCRKLLIAMLLLVVAITAVLVRDSDSWFGSDDQTAAVESEQPTSMATVKPAVEPLAAEVKTPVATKHSAGTTAGHKASGRTHFYAGASSSPVKRERPRILASAGPATAWGQATTAAEKVHTSEQAPAHPQYPLLTEATAVQGSVLLQALIAADGSVEELRVISGPTILVSAARQAVQEWRFKPYLLNGKPVETYARVTVNFTIDVSNTEARYHVNSVTSAGAL
ncbi:MAG: energy transducer TonB [Terriglobales bacterium]